MFSNVSEMYNTNSTTIVNGQRNENNNEITLMNKKCPILISLTLVEKIKTKTNTDKTTDIPKYMSVLDKYSIPFNIRSFIIL